MCPIIGTLPAAIRIYWDLGTILMQKIKSHKSDLSLVMKRIKIEQRRHMKPLVEVVASVTREVNAKITVASRSATRTNLTEGIIMEIKTILETVFKRG